MSSTWKNNLSLSIFGQSHGVAIGMTLDGVPAGEAIDLQALQAFLDRRAPGKSPWSTPRKESDTPEFLSGLLNGKTCGAPIAAIIRNENTRSQDYDNVRNIPRPGHADFTAHVKYRGYQDVSGGGHFSGRLTAALCIAGGICLQILARRGIMIEAKIVAMGDVDAAKQDGDSVGGVIECTVNGLPVGLGEPMFDGMENKIAGLIFGIPAVRGIEFGTGFAAAAMCGSQHNDLFILGDDGAIKTQTNHHGGILGGITSGMPLTFRVAIKPTPSIAKAQQSVNVMTNEPTTLVVKGRHDPCIVPRAVPCVEAAAAVAVLDAMLMQNAAP
ncbi:MAG: chorismate synthase [Oscillospiraceae bacterium]|nr:chorismate synthase [Oscillospiraceae bacterium]